MKWIFLVGNLIFCLVSDWNTTNIYIIFYDYYYLDNYFKILKLFNFYNKSTHFCQIYRFNYKMSNCGNMKNKKIEIKLINILLCISNIFKNFNIKKRAYKKTIKYVIFNSKQAL